MDIGSTVQNLGNNDLVTFFYRNAKGFLKSTCKELNAPKSNMGI
jgi:hypothetical protein